MLGFKIRTLRREKGYSLDKLAELTQTSKSYLWDLEVRAAQRPSADKINKIATALGVTADYLLSTQDLSPDQQVADQAFFRKYQRLAPDAKRQLGKILEVLIAS